ncbi:UDP-N-acetylenolpyruvoylglucosamine reductase [Oceanibacterium hippocampi]|uniref:UDP-N-acetylenolpyruvoylglucosamine reductase n=2 Tax=Oceanibacterium hippocampi TaxID=745714 RepID=A0A1Y5SC15_9PROT|nr:UDP-N-acetylenolpyruvoylglucosamine reductase [Oceanibacterium hippocampi]
MALERNSGLIDRLPAVRGSYRADVPLAKFTWFRVGGPAEVQFKPADADDLAAFLAGRPADVPVTVIGVGTNMLIRDGGIRGVVVRLGPAFAEIAIADGEIVAGAAAQDLTVARSAARAGVAGLEFLSGIPGVIGGALRMNAGAYGREISDVLVSASALDGQGGRHELAADELGLTYRHSSVPGDWIFISARLRGGSDSPAAIEARMAEIQAKREASQPIRARTGGSTFANPPGRKAWELIDGAGCRGLRRGGAMVSEQHTNFLINTGTATAADLEGLGEEVRRRVFEKYAVELRWEIERVGEFADKPGRTVA